MTVNSVIEFKFYLFMCYYSDINSLFRFLFINTDFGAYIYNTLSLSCGLIFKFFIELPAKLYHFLL